METKKPEDLKTTYSRSPGHHTSHTLAQTPRCHVEERKVVVTKTALSQTKLQTGSPWLEVLTPLFLQYLL